MGYLLKVVRVFELEEAQLIFITPKLGARQLTTHVAIELPELVARKLS